jgi:hypothetical protein
MTVPYELAFFAERNRNIVFDTVIEAIERAAAEEGVTQADIAKTTGRTPAQISAWLSGPSNWTQDTVSHLLRSIRATMTYKVVFDKDQPKANFSHPAMQDNPKSFSVSNTTAREATYVTFEIPVGPIITTPSRRDRRSFKRRDLKE